MCMSSVKFKIDRVNARIDLLAGNNKYQNLSYNAMQRLLPVIEAQFFQQFGVVGKFSVEEFLTDRYTVRISADSPQTSAVLAAHPKWLNQFIDNIQI